MSSKYNPYSTSFSFPPGVGKPALPLMMEIASVPDDHKLTVSSMDLEGGARFRYSGNFELPELEGVEIEKIILGGEDQGRIAFDIPDFAFNRICEPDRNQRTLRFANQIVTDNSIPVLNRPAAVLETTRDRIYQRFHDYDGIQVPKTIRIAPRYCSDVRELVEKNEITLPFIFRPAGGHDQMSMHLVKTLDDIRELERFAFDGRDYYLIEFVDFQDDDGFYRKFRAVAVGGKIYPRHLFISRQWMVGSHTAEKGEEFLNEEKELLGNFEERFGKEAISRLEALSSAVGLDLFGFDLSLRPDGTLLLFEMNACMAVYVYDEDKRAYVKSYVENIRQAVRKMVQDFSASCRAEKH